MLDVPDIMDLNWFSGDFCFILPLFR